MISYLLYKTGEFISLYFPLKISYGIAIFCSNLYHLFIKVDRRTVRANLKAIFPDKQLSEIESIRSEMFINFARYLVDFFRFPLLNQANIKNVFRLVNQHYLEQALANGKGAIIVSAHLGNWELGGIGLALAGYPIGVVVLSHQHKRVDEFFNLRRKEKGVIVMPLGNAVKDCLSLLRQNKAIALIGDRTFDSSAVELDFFGLKSHLPKGPAILSLKTGAPIVLAFTPRCPDGSYQLIFEKAIAFVPSGNRDKDIIELSNRYKTVIENYIKCYPEQWFMFRKFWAKKA